MRDRVVALALAGCGSVAGNPGAAMTDATVDTSVGLDSPAPRCNPTAAFGAAVPLTALNTTPSSDESAFLTADELTIYFSSTRAGGQGGWDVWFSQRTDRNAAFPAPSPLGGAVNTAAMQRRPVVTGDGLFMYADSFNTNYDLSVSTRADTNSTFSTFTLEPTLNISTNDNDNDPYALPNHTIYFASAASGISDIYRATWTGTAFTTPEVVTGVNLGAGDLEASPVLTPDELTMFFQSSRTGSVGGSYDIWMTTRTSLVAGFTNPVNVASLNTTEIDVPNWVSTDGCVLYFTRNVSSSGTDYDLFVATRGN